MSFKSFVFFDDSRVRSSTSAAKRRVLSRFGAFTRATTRLSIRKKKTASKPGSPPRSVTGKLKKHIYFGYEKTSESVVIGPAKLQDGNAPAALEYGSCVVLKRNPRRVVRKIGDTGVIRIDYLGPSSITVKDRRGNERHVVFAKIRTPKQLKRCNRFEEDLWGPLEYGIKVAERPYQRPAFAKELGKMPPDWRDTIR